MSNLAKLPIAHLVNPDPVELASENLIDMLEKGDRNGYEGLVFLDRQNHENRRSYRELLEGARVVATYLRNRGLQRGDKVVLLLHSSSQFTDAFFGTILAGGVPIPASLPMTFGDISKYLTNLGHIVRNSEARFIITFPRVKGIIGNVLGEDNHLQALILSEEITPEPALYPGFPTLDPDDPAFLQYTSGTTTMPKGVVLTHRAILSNSHGITQAIQVGPDHVGLSWLPLYHDMGLIGGMITALYSGTPMYMMMPESFLMNPMSWLRNITQYRATVVVAPNFAYHLCSNRVGDSDLGRLDLSSLKVAMNGAEPIDLRTLTAFENRFSRVGFKDNVIFPVYGMAENTLAATFPELGLRYEVEPKDREQLEMNGVAVPARADDPTAVHAVSVGAPLAGQQIAIQGEGRGFAREGVVGEILVKSPSLMKGYFKNEAETEKVLRDGWLHTGDLGFINNGRLFITGRSKEMIIKRGRNFYPYDIERVASNVEGVRKGCLVAFASPNADTGTEDLVMVVETREIESEKKRKIEQSIAGEVMGLIGIKPDHIVLVPPKTIPKTSSGKLQRLLCKQRYMDGTLLKGFSDRWFTPVKTVVGSFIGQQRFRMRARQPS